MIVEINVDGILSKAAIARKLMRCKKAMLSSTKLVLGNMMLGLGSTKLGQHKRMAHDSTELGRQLERGKQHIAMGNEQRLS